MFLLQFSVLYSVLRLFKLSVNWIMEMNVQEKELVFPARAVLCSVCAVTVQTTVLFQQLVFLTNKWCMPTLMAQLFSEYPRNANLVLNSPWPWRLPIPFFSAACHNGQVARVGQVCRHFLLFLLKWPYCIKGSKIHRAKERGSFTLQSNDKGIHPKMGG